MKGGVHVASVRVFERSRPLGPDAVPLCNAHQPLVLTHACDYFSCTSLLRSVVQLVGRVKGRLRGRIAFTPMTPTSSGYTHLRRALKVPPATLCCGGAERARQAGHVQASHACTPIDSSISANALGLLKLRQLIHVVPQATPHARTNRNPGGMLCAVPTRGLARAGLFSSWTQASGCAHSHGHTCQAYQRPRRGHSSATTLTQAHTMRTMQTQACEGMLVRTSRQ